MKKKKFSGKQKDLLKYYWAWQKKLYNDYWGRLMNLQELMEAELGVEGIEFFFCDGEVTGIGTTDRGYELLHDTDLEDKELK